MDCHRRYDEQELGSRAVGKHVRSHPHPASGRGLKLVIQRWPQITKSGSRCPMAVVRARQTRVTGASATGVPLVRREG
jgi:hypothetical protein